MIGPTDVNGLVIPYSEVAKPSNQDLLKQWHSNRPTLICNCCEAGPRVTVRKLNDFYFFATFPNQSHLHQSSCRYQEQAIGGDSISPMSLDDVVEHSTIIKNGSIDLSKLSSPITSTQGNLSPKEGRRALDAQSQASSPRHSTVNLDRLLGEIWAFTFRKREIKDKWNENAGCLINTLMTTKVLGKDAFLSDYCRVCYFNPKTQKSKMSEAYWFKHHFSQKTKPLFIVGAIKKITSRAQHKGGGVKIDLFSFPRPLAIMSKEWDQCIDRQHDEFQDAFLSSEEYCRLGLFRVRLTGENINSPIIVDAVGVALVSEHSIFQ
ncbi:DUF1173 family protein [Porticoccaceae bacterium]|nr:DUF1173 family protein [Porticoccaceae bacterium]